MFPFLFNSIHEWLKFYKIIHYGCYIGYFFDKKIILKKSTNPLNEYVVGTCIGNIQNFVKIYGIVQINNCSWILLDYKHGTTLDLALKQNSLSVKRFAYICHSICDALVNVQNKYSFVHNDLHPKNIIITENYDPVIIDYELSTICETTPASKLYDINFLLHNMIKISNQSIKNIIMDIINIDFKDMLALSNYLIRLTGK
jgi:serine/threonine protein kinase